MAGFRQWLLAPPKNVRDRILQTALRVLSVPYRLAVQLRAWAYDRGLLAKRQLDIPVICIGNLTVGGTGKTPMVAWVARYLRSLDRRVAIVSRGYGQLESGSNDEALELELLLPDVPHLQNPDRFAAGLIAQNELEMQVLVLDDGFQHRRLARNLDIVLVDATDPPQAHHLLPGGLMREPWSGLRRAGVVILTRVDLATEANLARIVSLVERFTADCLCIHSWYAPIGFRGLGQAAANVQLESLRGKSVLAICGIGNPEAFFKLLVQSGMRIADHRDFPDHHAYQASDVEELTRWTAAHADCLAVVCTMKDWVKLQIPSIGSLPLLALAIDVKIAPQDREKLEQVLACATDPALIQAD